MEPRLRLGVSIGGCEGACASKAGFIFTGSHRTEGFSGCMCCGDLIETEDLLTQWSLYGPASAVILGGPHITTFDGQRYTLLSRAPFRCGTSQVWRRTFIQKRFPEPRSFLRIGRSMHTILVSSPSLRACFSSTSPEDPCDKCSRSLHRTVRYCKWKARKGNEEWTPGGKPAAITGFDLSRTVTGPHGHRFPNRVGFNKNTKDGKSDIAVLSLSCRPDHNLNVHIYKKKARATSNSWMVN